MVEESARRLRVFLADDHLAMRKGLSLLLRLEGHEVCGEAENRAEFLGRIDGSRADVALVDLTLGEESGLDLIEDLLARNIPALIYSMHEDRKTIEQSFACGACGYVTKREVEAVLMEALAEVGSGRRFVSPRALRSLANRSHGPVVAETVALSPREEQVLVRLGRGETNAEIASALQISDHTVKTYYTRLLDKFGLGGMSELRKFAIKRGT